MTRLGWILLLVFAAVAGAFVFLLSRGGDVASPGPAPASDAAPRTVEGGGPLVIPVAGVQASSLTDTWGDARGGGTRTHNAIDIMAPRGTPVVAAAPGTVEKLFNSENGGLTIYVRSTDGRTVHYYAHLDAYREGLAEGQQVRTGDVIGTVGSTGSASEEGPHLHFEVKRMAPGERWHQGREVNPYPLLAGKAASR